MPTLRTVRYTLAVLSSSVAIASLGACSGAQTGPGTSPPPTATAPATAPPPTIPSSSATSSTPMTPASATAPLPTVIDPSVLQALLLPLAQKSAPGMKPEGPPISGLATPGQPLTQSVTLQPSGTRCYTAIAGGAPPVTDLVVELWANPPAPLPPTLVSQSQGTGPQAVMAGSPNCFKNLLPVPVPAVLKVTARAGGGPVLAQLYSK